eukprot:8447690-Heterocapsa_arctica.AAC.1
MPWHRIGVSESKRDTINLSPGGHPAAAGAELRSCPEGRAPYKGIGRGLGAKTCSTYSLGARTFGVKAASLEPHLKRLNAGKGSEGTEHTAGFATLRRQEPQSTSPTPTSGELNVSAQASNLMFNATNLSMCECYPQGRARVADPEGQPAPCAAGASRRRYPVIIIVNIKGVNPRALFAN